MTHLTDMEELLSSIPSDPIRDYMREAMNCYMAGAYRGCLVLSYIALFDDLLAKLGEFAKVNSIAKGIFDAASKKRADQEVFESFLIDQLSANNLMPLLDAAFLDILRILRNKSAHPSGHKPSPEEARFVFYEAITRVLAKPILSTTQLVEQITTRFSNANYFPSVDIGDIAALVQTEIGVLHEAALPMLVTQCISLSTSPSPNVAKNAKFFIAGLARQNSTKLEGELRARLVVAKADDLAFSDLVLQTISANGKLVVGADNITLQRIGQLLTTAIAQLTPALPETKLTHPYSVLKSMAGSIPEATIVGQFGAQLKSLLAERPYSTSAASLATGRPTIGQIWIDQLVERAGSADFSTANRFANELDALDPVVAPIASDADAFRIIAAVCRAAEIGAFSSRDRREAKFAGSPLLRAKAVALGSADPAGAAATLAVHGIADAPSKFVADHLQ